ncbi:MAG: hypothetical protein K0R63_913 [Rickettsiales bacterium]|jgi:hypothetical protein|nr:hypothetical protein [Rickettsiales bacterium]
MGLSIVKKGKKFPARGDDNFLRKLFILLRPQLIAFFRKRFMVVS